MAIKMDEHFTDKLTGPAGKAKMRKTSTCVS